MQINGIINYDTKISESNIDFFCLFVYFSIWITSEHHRIIEWFGLEEASKII